MSFTIPSPVQNIPLVDKDGMMTKEWFLMFSQFFTQMQQAFSNEGFILPSLNSMQIAVLNAMGNSSTEGQMLVNSTSHVPIIYLDGSFKTITTS